eukprot:TRINITY_DN20184_c0_g2_i1.p1 TRINITY_DN20184_c0_g2~~TRINITY_DN20184_c0_g2_i1.p1  ORF type:complete len:416 (-),score=86.59 TRINITY_DN20184_c0_g2_i1:18-1265(-)
MADSGTSKPPVEEAVEELVELQLVEEARLEQLFNEKKAERGLDDEETLEVFFKLFDMWIQLYRLNKSEEALTEILPICRNRGGKLRIKAVQALAFTVWKQSKFQQAIELFQEMEELVGASSALCENIGHTYSSLGDYDNASRYFNTSLQCIENEAKLGQKSENRAGVLLGLGLIEDRQGNYEKALETVREAQVLFRQKAKGKPASLVAKAGMSIAKILLKLALTEKDEAKRIAMEEEAVEREEENVQLFEVTCGEDSPLTASALRGLGEAYLRRGRATDAQKSFARSYALEAKKDAFDLVSLMQVHNELVSAHMAGIEGLDRSAFRSYFPTIDTVLKRVREMPQDANAGAYYKVAGEMRAFGEDYAGSSALLGEAIMLFELEEVAKVGGLIAACRDVKTFCDGQLSKASKQAIPT